MELEEALATRRSIRRYRRDDVSRDTLERVFNLALMGPSGWGLQKSRFVIVQGEQRRRLQDLCVDALPEVRTVLEEALPDRPDEVDVLMEFYRTYGNAPVLVVVYAGLLPDGDFDDIGAALSVQNLFLAAHAAGLGTVWTSIMRIREAEINTLLGVGTDQRIACITPLGYPDEQPSAAQRTPGRLTWIGF
ncbi:nitroreductase family protein [Micromonospora sp. NPDC048830]|uniref:nitroreductase family protein n=1 Tax=Micromonospora sp. NPDC048830 TaxID=3364257 RepID=UPI00371A97D9